MAESVFNSSDGMTEAMDNYVKVVSSVKKAEDILRRKGMTKMYVGGFLSDSPLSYWLPNLSTAVHHIHLWDFTCAKIQPPTPV